MTPYQFTPPVIPPNSAVTYGRLSKEDQSLASHEERCVMYAGSRGLTIVAKFTDPDTSGGIPILERDAGSECITRLRGGAIRHLIIVNLDRLGRNARDVLATIEMLEQLKVTLHIVDCGGDAVTTQGIAGKLILSIFAAVAEWERGAIRARTQKLIDYKRLHGEVAGTIPFGMDAIYHFTDGHTLPSSTGLSAKELAALETIHGDITRKTVVPNAAEQSFLRHMQSLRQQGLPLKRIAATMNAMGCRPKRGGPWQVGNVDGVLRNKATTLILAAAPQSDPAAKSDQSD